MSSSSIKLVLSSNHNHCDYDTPFIHKVSTISDEQPSLSHILRQPYPPPLPQPTTDDFSQIQIKFKYSANNYIRTLLLRLPFPLGFSLLVSFGFFSFLTGGLPLPAVFLSRAPFPLPLAGAPPKKARMSWTEKLHYLVTCRKPTTVRVTNIKVSELTDMDIVKKN